jgi:hypothetical protein
MKRGLRFDFFHGTDRDEIHSWGQKSEESADSGLIWTYSKTNK